MAGANSMALIEIAAPAVLCHFMFQGMLRRFCEDGAIEFQNVASGFATGFPSTVARTYHIGRFECSMLSAVRLSVIHNGMRWQFLHLEERLGLPLLRMLPSV